ncbi:MAG: hypothetical protein Q7K35_06035, partial [bacterium]|nr:hypothetical protein [bacterium]
MSNQEFNQKNDIQFITCSVCDGSGRASDDSVCKNCSGDGLMAFYQGRFYYYNLELSQPMIQLRHLRNSFHLVINLSAYVIGLIGIVGLAYWVYLTSLNTESLSAFAFWRSQSIFILLFWVSLIADMFIIYRLSEEEAAKQKIKKAKY